MHTTSFYWYNLPPASGSIWKQEEDENLRYMHATPSCWGLPCNRPFSQFISGAEGKIGAEGHYQATEEASHSVQTQILISQMEQPKHFHCGLWWTINIPVAENGIKLVWLLLWKQCVCISSVYVKNLFCETFILFQPAVASPLLFNGWICMRCLSPCSNFYINLLRPIYI